jgi:hypothetical protein
LAFATDGGARGELAICGDFRVEGRLRASALRSGFVELVTDEGARSERRIVLEKVTNQALSRLEGMKVSGRLRIEHFCVGDCFGRWISTERLIAPYETPRSFSASMLSSQLQARPCLTLSEARLRTVGR